MGTDLDKWICDKDHDFYRNFYGKKRGWREVPYNSQELLSKFPQLTKTKIMSYTGGTYSYNKGQGYFDSQLNKLSDRNSHKFVNLNESRLTVGSVASSIHGGNSQYKAKLTYIHHHICNHSIVLAYLITFEG